MIRIIVADDHHLVREGLVRLLALEKDIQVLAVASNGEDAIAPHAKSPPNSRKSASSS
jgi:two-component system response regulator DegU